MGLYGIADLLDRNETSRLADLDRPALICDERSLTYGELRETVRTAAAGLAAAGFERGDALALFMRNSLEYLPLVFAVAHLGGRVVPLNYFLKPREVSHAVNDSGARWLAGDPSLWETIDAARPDLPAGTRLVSVGDPGAEALLWGELMSMGEGKGDEAVPVSTEDHFLLQYSSGTTGFPKAIAHTHGTVLFNAAAQVIDFRITEDDVHLVVPALCWAAGMHCITLGALWRGATVVVRPSGEMTADNLFGLIQRHGATTMMLAPSVLRIVLGADRAEDFDLSSVRLVLSGGESVPAPLLEAFQRYIPSARLMQGYGVSEFPSTMAYFDSDEVGTEGSPAGRASMLAKIKVVGEDDADLPAGTHGEIVVRAPSTAASYHDNPEATAAMSKNGWLHTGDQGWVDDYGLLHIAGRVKDMIISGGLNVYPAEIERVLDDHPDVIESAVIGVPHDRYGEAGHAIVVVAEPDGVDVAVLEARCRDELANFKVPRTWEVRVEPLPRTVSGKVRKFLLEPQVEAVPALDD
jgi:fatty-acyl-CoA synthase